MKIRPMKDKDLQAVAQLLANEYAKPPWNVHAPIEDTLASVTFFYKRGAGFVAENNSIMGALIYDVELYQKGKVASIKEFVVSSEHQGKGIGTGLLGTFENACTDAIILKLGTNEDASAVKFYESRGYHASKGSLTMTKTLKKID